VLLLLADFGILAGSSLTDELSVFRSNFRSWNSGHVLKTFEVFLECDTYVKLVEIACSATFVNRLAGDPLAFALWNAVESLRPGDED